MPEYRRRLPHFHPDDACIFFTWRLSGSLPVRDRRLQYPTALVRGGWPILRIAQLVARAIRAGAGEQRYYELLAWVIMPNHVHLLILPKVAISRLMHWLKGSTARRANEALGRTGQPFWQDESYDHYVRDREERDRIIAYIENNPVKAGLVAAPELWAWSSAGQGVPR